MVGEVGGLSQSKEITWLNVDPSLSTEPQQKKKFGLAPHPLDLLLLSPVHGQKISRGYPIAGLTVHPPSPYGICLMTGRPCKTGTRKVLALIRTTRPHLPIFHIISGQQKMVLIDRLRHLETP